MPAVQLHLCLYQCGPYEIPRQCFQVHEFLHVIRKNESTSWIAASNAVPGPFPRVEGKVAPGSGYKFVGTFVVARKRTDENGGKMLPTLLKYYI